MMQINVLSAMYKNPFTYYYYTVLFMIKNMVENLICKVFRKRITFYKENNLNN